MSQPLLIDQHIGSAIYIETMRDEFILNSISESYTRLYAKFHVNVYMFYVVSRKHKTQFNNTRILDENHIMDPQSVFKKLDLSLYDLEKITQHVILSITDSDGNIIYVSKGFCKISKYSEDELIGKNHRILKSERHPPEFFKDMWQTISSGKTWKGEIRNLSKNGNPYWVYSIIIPLHDNQKTIVNYASINTDITKEKELDERVKELAQELVDQNTIFTDQLQTKSEELVRSERLATIGTMSSRIAHDLKNPLTVIQTYADMLNSTVLENLSPTERDRWFRIQTSITDMQRIIEDVLDFARTTELKKHRTSLLKILRLAINHIRTPFGVHIHLPEKDMIIPCDERKMEAVFSNLLANSVSALDGPGEINVEFSSDKVSYIIKVKDSGSGIPVQHLNRIFEPLYTTKKTGTGLGLVICKSIIEQHGGTITAQNKPTTFTISLPKN